MKLPEYIQRSDYLLICCLFLRNTIISMFFSNPVMFPFGLSIVLYIFFLYIQYILYIRSAFFKIMFSPLLINNRIYFYIHTSNKIWKEFKTMKKTKKGDTINIRLPKETKELLKTLAKNQGKSCSGHLRLLIERDANAFINNQNTQQNTSHEQITINSLKENQFIHSLLTNKEFSNKSKAIIGREIRKYVWY